jgi:hypothetical protein
VAAFETFVWTKKTNAANATAHSSGRGYAVKCVFATPRACAKIAFFFGKQLRLLRAHPKIKQRKKPVYGLVHVFHVIYI